MMSVKEFCGLYKEMAEINCFDGIYRNLGLARSTAGLIEAGAESVEIIETSLRGWGYSVHAVVDLGMGHKMSIFAR